MEKHEKEYILNKGLILGIVLMFFPIIDLIFGMDISWIRYLLIFYLFWTVVYTFLLVKWVRKYASHYHFFSFRYAFRMLFVISALGYSILTVGKIVIWNVSYQEKYIELTEHFWNDMFTDVTLYAEQENKELLKNGDIDLDKYEDKDIELKARTEESNLKLQQEFDSMKQEGIGVTFFIKKLITRLFFIAIYCAILALFVRKKEQVIITN